MKMIKKSLKKLRDKFLSPVLNKQNELADAISNKLIENTSDYAISNKLNVLEYIINTVFITEDNIGKIQEDLSNFFSTSYAVYQYSAEEMFMQEIYSLIVKEGDCVIDVGANHGLHTIPLSKLVGKSGRVIACEAVQSNVDDIKEKIDTDNVSFYCAAITKPQVVREKKKISFTYYPDRDGWSGIKENPDVNLKKKIITVPALTLDKIVEDTNLDEHIKISFIKVDTEGGEFDVLLGSEKIFKKYKPVVYFEDHKIYSANLYNYTKNDFFRYLYELGYELFPFTGGKYDENEWGGGGDIAGTWLVHTESKYKRFFERTYMNLAISYMLKIRALKERNA
jgi:FkbM family methyltransferase